MPVDYLRPWIPDILEELRWPLSDSLPLDDHETMMARDEYTHRLTAILSQQYYSHWDDVRWDYWKSALKDTSSDEDYLDKIKWYAEKGVIEAMLELWLYLWLMENEEGSKYWLERAGSNWIAAAYIELSDNARHTWEEADIYIGYMKQAADLWDVAAMRHMAHFYSERFWYQPNLEQYNYWKNMAIQHGSELAKTLRY